jgi:aminoglycoside phosphotransferase (APT) family kinase protein
MMGEGKLPVMMTIIFLDIDGVIFYNPMNGMVQNRVKERFIEAGKLDEYEKRAFNSSQECDKAAVDLFSKQALDYLDQFIDTIKHHTNHEVGIVLSTAWRTKGDIDFLKKLFQQHRFSEYIIDKTPDTYGSRGEQIQTWLSENQAFHDVKSFVILDDYDGGLSEAFPEQLIMCDDYKLFGPAEYQRAFSAALKPWNHDVKIDETRVHQLIETQFPQWADLPVKPIMTQGWDNRTFHLGEQMIVRLPSAVEYAWQVEKEQLWLPKLASHLPLRIPVPLAMGKPDRGYPWSWSIYSWLEGESASVDNITDLSQFAIALAEFLQALHQCDTTGGPLPGHHNFYRGGELRIYHFETERAWQALREVSSNVWTLWTWALKSTWQHAPVWIHGDISSNNLLVKDGKLSAVIDFGQLGIGDPACDLTIAWTLFDAESRQAFRAALPAIDKDTWTRARAWAIWKALMVWTAPHASPLDVEESKRILEEVVYGDN